jgi:F-type H+-transporting ATPase subunit a
MSKKQRIWSILIFIAILIILLVGIILTGQGGGEEESIQEVLKDGVLHEHAKISLFGLIDVNPGLISAMVVTGCMLIFGLICRIFVIPKFKMIPGKFQLVLETLVGMFDGLAKGNSPHRNKFLGAYIFTAGAYIFIGTMFELFGVQAITTKGTPIALPAPLSDINGAIMMGCLSYLVIMSGGLAGNGFKGILKTLKDFSLPISMSFRLFGALLSGAMVTELVYYYTALSYVLPVVVGVLFTVLHALIQAYVLTMLTSLFYGEVSEVVPKKVKNKKNNDDTNSAEVLE